jgi:hypothetical protein
MMTTHHLQDETIHFEDRSTEILEERKTIIHSNVESSLPKSYSFPDLRKFATSFTTTTYEETGNAIFLCSVALFF